MVSGMVVPWSLVSEGAMLIPTCQDLWSNEQCAMSGRFHRDGFDGFLKLLLLRLVGAVAGPPWPDVEAAFCQRRNIPTAPDAEAVAKAVIEDLVGPGIRFCPPAFAVGAVITAVDQEPPDVIGAVARHPTLCEGEVKVHAVTILGPGIIVKTGPRS